MNTMPSQLSLNEQIAELINLGVKNGLYDAVDHLKSLVENTNTFCIKHGIDGCKVCK